MVVWTPAVSASRVLKDSAEKSVTPRADNIAPHLFGIIDVVTNRNTQTSKHSA